MGRNGSGRSRDRVAANGAAEARVRSAVLTIACLLGRQIAREQFERQASANENSPVKETGDRQERSHDPRRPLRPLLFGPSERGLDRGPVPDLPGPRGAGGLDGRGHLRDAAISGDSVILRPGIQALLADARSGAFDVVAAEACCSKPGWTERRWSASAATLRILRLTATPPSPIRCASD